MKSDKKVESGQSGKWQKSGKWPEWKVTKKVESDQVESDQSGKWRLHSTSESEVRTINFGPCSTSDQMLNFGPFYVELRTLFNLGPHSRWDHQLLNFGPVHVRTTFTLGPTTFQGFSYTVADQKVLYQKVLHFLVMSCPPKSVTYFQKTKWMSPVDQKALQIL